MAFFNAVSCCTPFALKEKYPFGVLSFFLHAASTGSKG